MNTFDSVLDDDHMEPDIKRAWLMVDNPLMHDNGSGLITLDEYAKRRIKQGLETADKRIKKLTAEITRLTAERDRFLNERSTLAVELAFANDAIKWQLEPKVAELTAALVECQQAGENGVVTMRYCTKCGAFGVPLARKRGSKDWLCLDCDYEVYGPAIYEPENDREPEDDALQQAFDNGRDVGERSVGYGELEY